MFTTFHVTFLELSLKITLNIDSHNCTIHKREIIVNDLNIIRVDF